MLRQCPVFATQAHNAQTAKCRSSLFAHQQYWLIWAWYCGMCRTESLQETRVLGFTFETLVVESPTLFPFALKERSSEVLGGNLKVERKS